MEQVKLWPANTLPIPFPVVFEKVEEEVRQPEIDIDDNFSKGQVHRYFPHQRCGFIKDRVGREIYFNLAELDFVGAKGREVLREGIIVGYDLSQSGKGLHVKRIKVY